MLTRRNVDHYAQSGGIGADVAERNVVLTYVLKALSEEKGKRPLLEELAFKGGTCLRKVYFGKTTRFSMDLDFTAVEIEIDAFRDRLRELLHNKDRYGITFAIDEEFSSRENTTSSYGAIINYAHDWRSSNFELNVSFREKPCLNIEPLPLQSELYFKYCEFEPFEVPCLQKEELIAEKIRAAFQRVRSRDLYDLYIYANNTAYNKEAVKALAVIKCWNVREPFDPASLLDKIANEEYDWSDLRRLVRPNSLPREETIIREVKANYEYLTEINKVLGTIIDDSRAHANSNQVESLIKQLRASKT